MITITIAELKKIACKDRLHVLIKSLGPDWPEDRPITVEQGLSANGIADVLRILSKCGYVALVARFALDCAERVRNHMADARSTTALDAALKFIDGSNDRNELIIAAYSAYIDHITDCSDESYSSYTASYAAYTASYAAYVACRTYDTCSASYVSAYSVSASDAAVKAASDHSAEQAWQRQRLIEMTTCDNDIPF